MGSQRSMSGRGGPDWAKRSSILAVVAIAVAVVGVVLAFWIGYAGNPGFRNSVNGFVSRVGPWVAAAVAVLVLGTVGTEIWRFRGRLLKASKGMRRLGRQVRWWVLWRSLEGDVRSRIESLSQVGAEVLAATLRLGEQRHDRRLFLSLREAEALVRGRRHPPQAGIGGTAWATKGCEELRKAGLVEQYGDATNQTWMVWLDKRVKGSRVGARMLDVVEGMLASGGQWRW